MNDKFFKLGFACVRGIQNEVMSLDNLLTTYLSAEMDANAVSLNCYTENFSDKKKL